MKRIQTRVTTLALAAAIFALNAYLCWGLFNIEYTVHMGSAEGPFIGLARYAGSHWGDLAWFPPWHLGMPFVNAYPPLLAYVVAAFAAISRMSIPHAFHWITTVAYCLGPAALFAFALRLTKSRWTAFAAGAMYSAISWSAWLIPAIAADLGSRAYPRRLQALVQYGESPHIFSMTLVPLALLLWDVAFERRSAAYVLFAAIATAATVLASWLGGFALALMVASYLVSRGVNRADVLLAAAIAGVAYCLAMPWAPPSTIAATQFNSKTLGGDFRRTYFLFPLWCAGAAALLGASKFAFRSFSRDAQFAAFFTLLTASVVFPSVWFGISVVPQPIRYHLELELGLSLLAAVALRPLWESRRMLAIGVLGLVLLYPAIQSRHFARRNLIRAIDITKTTEWKIAQWLNREWSGERVMMSGSVTFWLTAFSDVPQLNGGTEQGAVDYMARVAAYGIYFGKNGEAAVQWLKALGVQAVAVSEPPSGEFYKPYADPHQFEGRLMPIYKQNGDTIYRVSVHTSLAHVIQRTALAARTPESGLDVDPLRSYVAALDNPQAGADFHWTSSHSARITAEAKADQVVSIQIPWHAGWRADGAAIHKDALGLMYLDSLRSGTIDLTYDGGFEMRIARALCAIAFLGLAAVSLWRS